ncbi:MAG TPA: S8 family serine peptidase [Gaiellaceae bacterium]|nr:S8 family serine peptidase [Gaiellaceae bacterium]
MKRIAATAPRRSLVLVATVVAALSAAAAATAAPYAPNDPLAPRQWHLAASRAFDFWESLPALRRVRVAVIDSGVDGAHPDLAGRVVAHRSFVGGSALEDTQGHGTFVAGLIAAQTGNGLGIAGMAPSADLVIAKVVDADGTIDVLQEAKAIRWAVDRGARVINMSLGGLRDPGRPERDTYAAAEAAALAYAKRRGVVVVASVGNSDAAPRQPWPYASYPAALPHVLGVAAVARDGSVPRFSNRDRIHTDLAAPGQALLSTVPLALTAQFRDCAEQGYSSCAAADVRAGEGTSFAAAQVSAAAAVILATHPHLRPEQVTGLLTRTAADATRATGCGVCTLGRDDATGWGRLDVAAALRDAAARRLPPRDAYEPNDGAGEQAFKVWGRATRRLAATLDYWDDRNDVYAVRLVRGQALFASLRGTAGTNAELVLREPGGEWRVDGKARAIRRAARPGPDQYLAYRAQRTGWHFVQVRLGTPGAGRYGLALVKE